MTLNKLRFEHGDDELLTFIVVSTFLNLLLR